MVCLVQSGDLHHVHIHQDHRAKVGDRVHVVQRGLGYCTWVAARKQIVGVKQLKQSINVAFLLVDNIRVKIYATNNVGSKY